MPASDDRFKWQASMAALIYGDKNESGDVNPAGWQCSDALDSDTVLMIYRRNLNGGVANNLTNQFPVTQAYLGTAGFRQLSQALVKEQPPTSPLFKVYAAQLPGFILQFEKLDGRLRAATASLATIDFFSVTATRPGQALAMDQRYFELYRDVLRLRDEQDSESKRSGLYQIENLHPETIANREIVDGHILSELDGEQLVVEFRAESK